MTTTTRRQWDVDTWYERYETELDQDTGTKLHSVRSIAHEVGVAHQAVARAFQQKRGGPAKSRRPGVLPWEVGAAGDTYTARMLRALIYRNTGQKVARRELSLMESWSRSLVPGAVVRWSEVEKDFVWGPPKPGEKIIHGVIAVEPERE